MSHLGEFPQLMEIQPRQVLLLILSHFLSPITDTFHHHLLLPPASKLTQSNLLPSVVIGELATSIRAWSALLFYKVFNQFSLNADTSERRGRKWSRLLLPPPVRRRHRSATFPATKNTHWRGGGEVPRVSLLGFLGGRGQF